MTLLNILWFLAGFIACAVFAYVPDYLVEVLTEITEWLFTLCVGVIYANILWAGFKAVQLHFIEINKERKYED